jgi:hypothetical protein
MLPVIQNVFAKDESYYDENWGLTNFRIDDERLRQEQTFAWWLSGSTNGFEEKSVKVAIGLTFNNGQYVVVTGNGLIGMHRPTATWDAANYKPGVVQGHFWEGGYTVQVGVGDFWNAPEQSAEFGLGISAISWSVVPDGQFGVVQMITRDSTTESWTDWRLDNVLPYKAQSYGFPHAPYRSGLDMFDTPNVPGNFPSILSVHCTDHFIQYFMFRPKPAGSGSIWVTLGTATWNWHGSAHFDPTLEEHWSWTDAPQFFHSQSIQPSTSPPEWMYRKTNIGGGN